MLKLIGFLGIEIARDADWDDIRQLYITELDSRVEQQERNVFQV